jgi:hypothetical protein
MEDALSFENTVVAVLKSGDKASEILDRLAEAGYEVEVLEGESGSAHLDTGGDDGFWASIKKAASALGDEKRVLERLDSALSEGSVVVSVGIGDSDSKEAVSILREHGGEYLWKFGDWTFTPIEI